MKKNNNDDFIEKIFIEFQAYIDPPNIDQPYLEMPIPKMDVISFIEKCLIETSQIDRKYIGDMFKRKANKSIREYESHNINYDRNYINSKKVLDYFNKKITIQPEKISFKDVNKKQLVWIFRILHQKGIINSDKKTLAKGISLLFNIEYESTLQYLSGNLKAPPKVFDCEWKDL
jgi:hypothetical protein